MEMKESNGGMRGQRCAPQGRWTAIARVAGPSVAESRGSSVRVRDGYTPSTGGPNERVPAGAPPGTPPDAPRRPVIPRWHE